MTGFSKEMLEKLCCDAFADGYASADGHGSAPWENSETRADLARIATEGKAALDEAVEDCERAFAGLTPSNAAAYMLGRIKSLQRT